MPMEPPPRLVTKFENLWRDWLYFFWSFVYDHTGGIIPTPPATGTSWNAHGNTATGATDTHLKIDAGSFIVGAVTPVGDTPAELSSAGTYFAFIPEKGGALRAGRSNASWGTIGSSSVAFGFKATATAVNAFAVGSIAAASNGGSIALGSNSESSGPNSIAIGNLAGAVTGTNNVAIGGGAKALGSLNSLAIGGETEVSASTFYSTAIGYLAKATLTASAFKAYGMAIGAFVEAGAADCTIIGSGGGGLFGKAVGKSFVNSKESSIQIGANIDTSAGDKATLTLFDKKCGVEEHDPLSTLDIGGSVGFKYTPITGTAGGTTSVGTTEEYTFRVNLNGMASGETHTMNLPAISGIDRRIYYFKSTDINNNASATAHLALSPNGTDSIEDFPGGSGRVVPGNGDLVLDTGDAITIIANDNDSTWWVI